MSGKSKFNADSIPDADDRTCAVCGRPLDHVGTKDSNGRVITEEWLHLHSDDQDHIPVPVKPDQVRTVYRCDFCDIDVKKAWRVPTTDFLMPHGGTSVGDWSACAACARFVTAENWGGLVQHVASVTGYSRQDPTYLNYLETTYSLVALHLTGKPEPLDEAT